MAEDRRLTDYGLEVNAVYTARMRQPSSSSPAFPFTRGRTRTVPRAAVGTIASTRATGRRRANAPSSTSPRARADGHLGRVRPADAARHDRTTHSRGEVARRASRSTRWPTWSSPRRDPASKRVSTSMTINAPAALLPFSIELVAEKQESRATHSGHRANERCSRSTSRGNYIFRRARRCGSPPTSSPTAPIGFPASTRSRSPGYHIREAGASAAQSSRSHSRTDRLCEAAVAAGLCPTRSASAYLLLQRAQPFFQEVAKFRAASTAVAENHARPHRRDEPTRTGPALHAQTGGSTLPPSSGEQRRPVAIQALSAICGGASRCTRTLDEPRAPERGARQPSRCAQQTRRRGRDDRHRRPARRLVLRESLPDELERQARALIARIDELGGAVAAIEQGFVQSEIEASAFRHQADVESASASSSA